MRRGLTAAIALSLIACGPAARTEIMLSVTADDDVRSDLASLRIRTRGGADRTLTFDQTQAASTLSWPVELGIVPQGGDSARTFEAEVAALDASGAELVMVRAATGFVPSETRVLRVHLESSCRGIGCAQGSSCTAGACAVVIPIDPRTLPPFGVGADAGGTDGGARDGGAIDGGNTDGGTRDGGAIDGGGCSNADADRDGVTECAGDCDDANALVCPTLPELCGDGIDNDCDLAAETGCGGRGTFVSALTGSDSNPGTRALPVDTIGRGITNAMLIGGHQAVVVAEGTYREKVRIVEGVDLLGAYRCDLSSCTWARDAMPGSTRLENIDSEGVVASASITPATLIERFHIVGLSAPALTGTQGSVGLTLDGGALTVRGNLIEGGNVTGGDFMTGRSVGLLVRSTVDAAGALIEGNTIRGASADNRSTAATLEWPFASPRPPPPLVTLRGNVLRAGTARFSFGLHVLGSAPGSLIVDNDIVSGDCGTTGFATGIETYGTLTIDGNRINVPGSGVGTCTTTGAMWASGINSSGSTSVITNNVIYGPTGGRTAAVVLLEAEMPAGVVVLSSNYLDGGGTGVAGGSVSAAVIVVVGPCTTCGFTGIIGRVRNNVLVGGANTARYGILEAPAPTRTTRPEVVQNNLFFLASGPGHTEVLYRRIDAAGVATDLALGAINALTTPVASANLSGDPTVDASWHLLTGSPCIDSGTMTEAPPIDFEGDPRPNGATFDIGPDER